MGAAMALAGFAIPPLPAARARALPLILSQDVAIAELAAAVESDPALVTALLRAANSAASSLRERVD
jgi:HD-like signal output (HDOD) protein